MKIVDFDSDYQKYVFCLVLEKFDFLLLMMNYALSRRNFIDEDESIILRENLNEACMVNNS